MMNENMNTTEQTNSRILWNQYFEQHWNSIQGSDQSVFFSKLTIEQLPKWLLTAVSENSMSFLDLGCAEGESTGIWYNLLTNSQKIVGIDFSEKPITIAKRRFPNIQFDEKPLNNFTDENFDIIFSSNLLNHLDDPTEHFNTISEKANKVVIITLPYQAQQLDTKVEGVFNSSMIPLHLANNFQLAWCKIMDCRQMEETKWFGEQAILVYVENNWFKTLNPSIEDSYVEAKDLVTALNRTESLLAQREEQIKTLNHQAVYHNKEISKLKLDLDLQQDLDQQLKQKEALINVMTNSISWRITKPLRFLSKLVRNDLTPEDRRNIHKFLLNIYYKLPTPIQNQAKAIYRRFFKQFIQRRIFSTALTQVAEPVSTFTGPIEKPRPQQDDLPDYIVWGVIDWHFRHQRPQQMALAVAQTGRRVFYISPNFVNDHSTGFSIESINNLDNVFQINLYVSNNPVIYAAAPNEDTIKQLIGSIGKMLEWADSRQIVNVIQHPFWTEIAKVLPNNRLVYDCMDHHEGFGNTGESLVELERDLFENSELVITTSAWLDEMVSKYSEKRALIRNAGEYSHFSNQPDDIYQDKHQRKIIGYYGAIAEWFDQDLVATIATKFPNHCILLVGADTVNAKLKLGKYPNVIFTGEVTYDKLPFYLYSFDVCLLPFQVIPLTLATNPVKLYEYLSAGKPTIAIDLPEMQQFGDLVYLAKTADDFIAQIEQLSNSPETSELIKQRKLFAKEQTWQHRAKDMVHAIENTEKDPSVSVIVVTYNNLELTQACLASIDAYSQYDNLEVIVVDNASSDNSATFLQDWVEKKDNRKLILNNDNKGFAAANNQGLHAASGEYLVLLNNDTYVTPGWLRTMINHLKRNTNIGILGPVTNNIGNEARIEIAYSDMNEMIEVSEKYVKKHIGEIFLMRTVAFFCVMFSRKIYETVGDLDEAFGRGFFEDDDYCRRIEQLGLNIACADDVFIHHQLSASFNKLKQQERQKLFEENKITYEKKWGEWIPHTERLTKSSEVEEIVVPSAFTEQKKMQGRCNVCGKFTNFFYTDPALWRESLNCQHCRVTSRYRSIARGILKAVKDITGVDSDSLVALPRKNEQKLRVYDTQTPFYYELCTYPHSDLLQSTNWINVDLSLYKPNKPLGKKLSKGVTNQNLEQLTFDDETFDIVITSDVIEHVRLDDLAHKEIYRVLKPGGVYIFTVPHNRQWSETLVRVKIHDPNDAEKDEHILEPEYHGDTNSDGDGGVLAYRSYGTDLDTFLESLGFKVEYSADELADIGIMNTELYYCRKLPKPSH